jgi:hypothetical protein
MEFSSCGCYLVACSNSSREVLVFDVQASATTSGPIATIPVAGIPVQLQCISEEVDDDVVLTVLVSFENSDGCLVKFSPSNFGNDEESSNGKRKASSSKGSLQTCSIKSNGSPLVASCFGKIGELNENGVSLVVGSLANPQFVHVQYVSEESGRLLASVSAAASTDGKLDTSSAKSASKADMVEAAIASTPMVLGPLEAGPTKKPKVDENALLQKYLATDGSNGAVVSAAVQADELTLEQRLEILSSSIAAQESSLKLAKSAASSSLSKPTSDSLVTLIDQALQLNDDSLLEECLACEDLAVVDATVSRLAANRVVPFLKKLVAKFEKRPSRSSLLTHWLSSILRMHASFLMSCPDLSSQLAGLSQILDQRLQSYTKLAALGGRLDLLMQQVTSNNTAAAAVSALDDSKRVPKIVYKDV